MASFMFFIASSLVSPCEIHPGKEGTYDVKPPSSWGSSTIEGFEYLAQQGIQSPLSLTL